MDGQKKEKMDEYIDEWILFNDTVDHFINGYTRIKNIFMKKTNNTQQQTKQQQPTNQSKITVLFWSP